MSERGVPRRAQHNVIAFPSDRGRGTDLWTTFTEAQLAAFKAGEDVGLIRAYLGGARADDIPTLRAFYRRRRHPMTSHAHVYIYGYSGYVHYFVHAWDRGKIVFATVALPDDGLGPALQTGEVDIDHLLRYVPAFADLAFRPEPYARIAADLPALWRLETLPPRRPLVPPDDDDDPAA
jgi:hypothetical protein